MVIYPDGTKFCGDWQDEQASGFGVLQYKNGDRFIGKFKAGLKDGDGRYMSKISYEGKSKIF